MTYSPIVLDHFFNPRNVGVFPTDDPDILTAGIGTQGVSDQLQLQIKLDTKHRICEVRFKAYGNPYSIAGLSWLSEQLMGKTRQQLQMIDHEAIVSALKVPPTKVASALLIEDLLRKFSDC